PAAGRLPPPLLREGASRAGAAGGSPRTAEEAAEAAARALTPGAPLAAPADLPAPSPESVARGREMYVKTCAGCHGETGKGDGTQDQRNDDGMPTRPRDLIRGGFTHGRDRDQLYARVTLAPTASPTPHSLTPLTP